MRRKTLPTLASRFFSSPAPTIQICENGGRFDEASMEVRSDGPPTPSPRVPRPRRLFSLLMSRLSTPIDIFGVSSKD